MPASEAQISASRLNGSRSRGPVTPEGKARSRANACKHGMAGSGVVVPADDSAEVARRSAVMLVEMAPKTEMGRFLVAHLAGLTVRVDRCSRHELAAHAYRAAHAFEAFDEARVAEVDLAISRLAEEPATHSRKLRSMPEGIDRLISLLLDLGDELEAGRWSRENGETVSHLTGRRWQEVPVTRARALSEAIGGDFQYLRPGDGDAYSGPDRAAWARDRMAALILEEVQSLMAARATLDYEAIERDRAGAADRAGFEPSKEASLARRYEAAAERGVFRALKELRKVEAEAAEVVAAEAPVAAAAGGPSGSFGAEPSRPVEPAAPTPRPATRPAPEPRFEAARAVGTGSGWSEVAVTVGRRSA